MKIGRVALKGIKWVLMALGLVWLVQAGMNLGSKSGPAQEESKLVFGEVTRGNLEDLVSSTGTLAAVGTVEVGSQVSGTIARLYVDFNDTVKKGQVLAELDTALFEADVADKQAALERAQAQLTLAEAELRRNKPLFDAGHLSEQEFLVLTTDDTLAKATLISAKAALKRSKANLDYAVIRSPIDGTVIERSIEEGQTVAASLAAPKLFVIAEDLSKMQIEALVDESDIGRIKVGQAVRFTVQTYPDDTFEGSVTQIRLNPKTISSVVNYTVIVNATNEHALLLPGMTATADFIVHQEKDVLMVPNAALRFRPEAARAGNALLAGKNGTPEGGSGRPGWKAGNRGEGQGAMANNDSPRKGSPRGPELEGTGEEPTEAKGEQHGQIYVEGSDGHLQSIRVEPGHSDGVVTVVASNEALQEGQKVATGLKEGARTQRSGGLFSMLRPRPPGSNRPK